MFKESATNLLDLPKEKVQRWLSTFDAVLTDCDGVLWHDDVAIPGSPQAVKAIHGVGKKLYFVTNNGTKTRHEIWQRAVALGYDIPETNIISPTHTIVEYLKNRNFREKVYVIGSDAIAKELETAGIENFGTGPDVVNGKMNDYINRQILAMRPEEVGAVVVGFDEHFSFGKMLKASNFLDTRADCVFLATNTDTVHKYPMYHIPGTGAIVTAVETCSAREALQMGKPNPLVCETLLQTGAIVPERTLMIGDCCKIDVTFGKNCGFQTLLVGTGSYQMEHLLNMLEDGEQCQKYIPDVYIPKLADLLQFLLF